MGRYAAGTNVPVERSKSEIEKTLVKYGATSFVHGWESGRAALEFEIANTRIRFLLPLPLRTDVDIKFSHSGKHERTKPQMEKAWDMECRQRWRALLLIIKAKLEAVESKITTFEEEFLPHLVMPTGETFGQWAVPQVTKALTNGKMPPLLPSGASKEGG